MNICAKVLDDNFVPDVLICPLGTSLIVTELLALSLKSKNPDIPVHVLEAVSFNVASLRCYIGM
jgi:hypothetical protein